MKRKDSKGSSTKRLSMKRKNAKETSHRARGEEAPIIDSSKEPMSSLELTELVKLYCASSDNSDEKILKPRVADCARRMAFSSHWLHRLSRAAQGQGMDLCELSEKELAESFRGQTAILKGQNVPDEAACVRSDFVPPSVSSIPAAILRTIAHSTTFPIQIVEYFSSKLTGWIRVLLSASATATGGVKGYLMSVADGLELLLILLPQYRLRTDCIYGPTGQPVPARFMLAASLFTAVTFIGGAVLVLKGLGLLDNEIFMDNNSEEGHTDIFYEAAMFGIKTGGTVRAILEAMLEYAMFYTAVGFERMGYNSVVTQILSMMQSLFSLTGVPFGSLHDSVVRPFKYVLPDFKSLQNPIRQAAKTLSANIAVLLANIQGTSSPGDPIKIFREWSRYRVMFNIETTQKFARGLPTLGLKSMLDFATYDVLQAGILQALIATKRKADCDIAMIMLNRYRTG